MSTDLNKLITELSTLNSELLDSKEELTTARDEAVDASTSSQSAAGTAIGSASQAESSASQAESSASQAESFASQAESSANYTSEQASQAESSANSASSSLQASQAALSETEEARDETLQAKADIENYSHNDMPGRDNSDAHPASSISTDSGLDLQSELDEINNNQTQTTASVTGLTEEVNTLKTSQNSGVVGYSTLSELNSNLNYDENTVAYVTNDSVSTNNGTYLKSGASGSGSWIQSSSDLASEAYQIATNVQSNIVNSNMPKAMLDTIINGNFTYDSVGSKGVISGWEIRANSPETTISSFTPKVLPLSNSVLANLTESGDLQVSQYVDVQGDEVCITHASFVESETVNITVLINEIDSEGVSSSAYTLNSENDIDVGDGWVQKVFNHTINDTSSKQLKVTVRFNNSSSSTDDAIVYFTGVNLVYDAELNNVKTYLGNSVTESDDFWFNFKSKENKKGNNVALNPNFKGLDFWKFSTSGSNFEIGEYQSVNVDNESLNSNTALMVECKSDGVTKTRTVASQTFDVDTFKHTDFINLFAMVNFSNHNDALAVTIREYDSNYSLLNSQSRTTVTENDSGLFISVNESFEMTDDLTKYLSVEFSIFRNDASDTSTSNVYITDVSVDPSPNVDYGYKGDFNDQVTELIETNKSKADLKPYLLGNNPLVNPTLDKDGLGVVDGTISGWSLLGSSNLPTCEIVNVDGETYNGLQLTFSDTSLSYDIQLTQEIDIPNGFLGSEHYTVLSFDLTVSDPNSVSGLFFVSIRDADSNVITQATHNRRTNAIDGIETQRVECILTNDQLSSEKLQVRFRVSVTSGFSDEFSAVMSAFNVEFSESYTLPGSSTFDVNQRDRIESISSELIDEYDESLPDKIESVLSESESLGNLTLSDTYADINGNCHLVKPQSKLVAWGDSITDQDYVSEVVSLLDDGRESVNNGIGGEHSDEILARMSGYVKSDNLVSGYLKAERVKPNRLENTDYITSWTRYGKKISEPNYIEFFDIDGGLLGRSTGQFSASCTFDGSSTVTSEGHPFIENDIVIFKNDELENGIYGYKHYYVKNVTEDSFTLHETETGDAITPTSGSSIAYGSYYMEYDDNQVDFTVKSHFSDGWDESTVIILAGTNDSLTELSGETFDNYVEMINAVNSLHKRVLLLTCWKSEAYDNTTETWEKMNQSNQRLINNFPHNVFDAKSYLMTQGDGSAEDNYDISLGLVPRSLRVDSVHLNGDGITTLAQGIVDQIKSKGW